MDNNVGNILDMADRLDLVPVIVKRDRAIVLGIDGNLFTITFKALRRIYSLYLSNKIPRVFFSDTKIK